MMFCESSIKRFLLFIFIGGFLWANLQAQNEPNPSPADTTKKVLNPIPPAEIQQKAEALLINIQQTVDPTKDIVAEQEFAEEINSLEESLEELEKESDAVTQDFIGLHYEDDLRLKWNDLRTKWRDVKGRLQKRTQEIQDYNNYLDEQAKLWQLTRDALKEDEINEALEERIRGVQAEIRAAQKYTNSHLANYVALQDRSTKSELTIQSYLDEIDSLEDQNLSNLLERTDPWIWSDSLAKADFPEDKNRLDEAFNYIVENTQGFLEDAEVELTSLIIYLLACIGLVYFLRTYIPEIEPPYNAPRFGSYFLMQRQPISSALLLWLLFVLFILENRPTIVSQMAMVFMTLPATIIFLRLSKKVRRWILLSLIGLFLLGFFQRVLVFMPSASRYILLFEALALVVILLAIIRNRKHSALLLHNTFFWKTLSFIAPIMLTASVIAAGATIVGYLALGRMLVLGMISSLVVGLLLILALAVIEEFIILASYAPPLGNSRIVQKSRNQILDTTIGWLSTAALFLWIWVSFSAFGMRSILAGAIDGFWNFGVTMGGVTVTVSDVLGFFFIVILAVFVANILRALVEDELLPNFSMKKGVPMAIGTIIRYTIIAIGFVLAIAAIGVDLNRISLLAGGLGVGLGFGLQNIVANFISGLILIFERPVMVGDIVEAEGIEGTVTSIGLRSSKILTYAGAEVSIPNSNLVSQRVSNWTLSSDNRRRDITITTSLNTDPDQVVEIAMRIMRQNPDVLSDPEPFVVFMGQKNQALVFHLYYWQTGNIFKARSALHLALFKELRDMGISIPIPVAVEIQTHPSSEQSNHILEPLLRMGKAGAIKEANEAKKKTKTKVAPPKVDPENGSGNRK